MTIVKEELRKKRENSKKRKLRNEPIFSDSPEKPKTAKRTHFQ
jgi:hypothetical protein